MGRISLADLNAVLGSAAAAWRGDELLAAGRLGRLAPNDDHLIVRDRVPVRVARAGTRIVDRRTTAWWNGFHVVVDNDAATGSLTVSGSVSADGPSLPSTAIAERGRFIAYDVASEDLRSVRSFTDTLRFDQGETTSLGPFAAAQPLRGFDPVLIDGSETAGAALVDVDGRPVADDADLVWRRQLGEYHEGDAERLRDDRAAVLTATLEEDAAEGTQPTAGELWIGEDLSVGWLDRAGFIRIADIERRWDRMDGPRSVLAGTYVETGSGWFRAEKAGAVTVLQTWSLTAIDPSWEIRGPFAERRIVPGEVTREVFVRTEARVCGIPVEIRRPWNCYASEAVEVYASDGSERTVTASDGAVVRFRARRDGMTAFVRPIDLTDLSTEFIDGRNERS